MPRFSVRMKPVNGEPDAEFGWPEAERDLVPCTFTVVAWRL